MTSAAPLSEVLTLFSKGKERKSGAAEVIFERVTKINNFEFIINKLSTIQVYFPSLDITVHNQNGV